MLWIFCVLRRGKINKIELGELSDFFQNTNIERISENLGKVMLNTSTN